MKFSKTTLRAGTQMDERGNRLSLVASRIWRQAEYEGMDYDMDGSGDCGGMIAASHRAWRLQVVADAGYATPGEYNADLRSRMVGADGKMSYRVYELLMTLEISDVCPNCGAALTVTSHYTRQYGGGYDTFEQCPNGDYAEVYV